MDARPGAAGVFSVIVNSSSQTNAGRAEKVAASATEAKGLQGFDVHIAVSGQVIFLLKLLDGGLRLGIQHAVGAALVIASGFEGFLNLLDVQVGEFFFTQHFAPGPVAALLHQSAFQNGGVLSRCNPGLQSTVT